MSMSSEKERMVQNLFSPVCIDRRCERVCLYVRLTVSIIRIGAECAPEELMRYGIIDKSGPIHS